MWRATLWKYCQLIIIIIINYSNYYYFFPFLLFASLHLLLSLFVSYVLFFPSLYFPRFFPFLFLPFFPFPSLQLPLHFSFHFFSFFSHFVLILVLSWFFSSLIFPSLPFCCHIFRLSIFSMCGFPILHSCFLFQVTRVVRRTSPHLSPSSSPLTRRAHSEQLGVKSAYTQLSWGKTFDFAWIVNCN